MLFKTTYLKALKVLQKWVSRYSNNIPLYDHAIIYLTICHKFSALFIAMYFCIPCPLHICKQRKASLSPVFYLFLLLWTLIITISINLQYTLQSESSCMDPKVLILFLWSISSFILEKALETCNISILRIVVNSKGDFSWDS